MQVPGGARLESVHGRVRCRPPRVFQSTLRGIFRADLEAFKSAIAVDKGAIKAASDKANEDARKRAEAASAKHRAAVQERIDKADALIARYKERDDAVQAIRDRLNGPDKTALMDKVNEEFRTVTQRRSAVFVEVYGAHDFGTMFGREEVRHMRAVHEISSREDSATEAANGDEQKIQAAMEHAQLDMSAEMDEYLDRINELRDQKRAAVKRPRLRPSSGFLLPVDSQPDSRNCDGWPIKKSRRSTPGIPI